MKKYKAKVFVSIIAFTVFAGFIRINFTVPQRLALYEGEKYSINEPFPFIAAETPHIGARQGSYNMSLRLFGIFEFKTIEVSVAPQVMVIPGGQPIGMRLHSAGPMVVGSEAVETDGGKINISKLYDIREGDRICSVDNEKCDSIKIVADKVKSGSEVTLGIVRGEKTFSVSLTPPYDTACEKYRLGLWLRDGTVGIGTISFIMPDTYDFGALGHGISDIDTKQLYCVDTGSVSPAKIFDVKKGRIGAAGELRGIVAGSTSRLGRVNTNTNCGVFGTLDALPDSCCGSMPIASRAQAVKGAAQIRSCTEGREPQYFDIEITKVDPSNLSGLKGMEIQITDRTLIDATGGIVQGMSGSPIIQDGRLIGAVTHVFINDPTRGYAIYAEDMLTEMNKG